MKIFSKGKKKGMSIGAGMQAILYLGVISIVIGVVMLVQSKILSMTGMTAEAVAGVNASLQATKDFQVTWMPIIFIAIGAGIVLTVLWGSLAGIFGGAER